MEEKMIKKSVLLGFLFLVLLSSMHLFAGGEQEEQSVVSKSPGEMSGEISIWSFTNEPEYFIEKFNEVYPNVKVNFTHISGGQNYITKINSALSTRNAPDIFPAEVSFIKQWIDINAWADLEKAPFNAGELSKTLIPYVVDMGRSADGTLKALSHQATPGGVFYRRSLAKEFFGNDDPDFIGSKMTDMDAFLELAAEIRDKSDNKVHLFASWKDLRWFPFNARSNPWVKDGELVIDKVVLDYFDLAKKIREEDLSAKADPSDPSWYSVMADGTVFSYILPTWGLHYELKPGAEPDVKNPSDYSGDWALTEGPQPYYWGGTWYGIYEGSKNKDLAWEFIKFVMFDQDFQMDYVHEKGDFVSNLDTIAKVRTDFSEPFLGGQNSYAFFADSAMGIDVSKVTKYDQHIEKMLLNAISLYVDNDVSKADALNSFKEEVGNAFPELTVK